MAKLKLRETTIIPRYQELQKQQNQPLMDFTPKCLYTKETGNNAVIVLENIKPHGFTLHPKEKSMDSAHIRLLLKSLAQWHALSFVLKDQYFEEFKKLNETHKVSPWGMIFETHLSKVYDYSHKALHQILEETGEYDVLSKFKAKFKNLSAKEMMHSLLNNDKSEKHAILIHGDCWNGNFMFQYIDQDHTEPTKVQILDFQIASLRSPITDVSEFIYSTASSEEFKNIRQILMEYYADLARNIRALGSDPDQVFSFSDFKEQWHKYSIHGITVALLAPVYLHLDDEPLDVANEEAMFDILPKQIAKPVVRKRMTDMAKCFASFEF
ncbi:uncharacterized protein LOC126742919 isoform X2 [Anthonomus grandis grandis]|uniref:uncharacterized protein LOC126742919 isoform X2 n=1 Tax=Anthonomus grandis grandis TaxID=2921223 RepID=UPI00216639F4|nr:uncharacterized protein LOC126742919 isoform X2 [Anthonomus grandis grandis]